jgi:hypothetical protein
LLPLPRNRFPFFHEGRRTGWILILLGCHSRSYRAPVQCRESSLNRSR